jgi:hypothetical protein
MPDNYLIVGAGGANVHFGTGTVGYTGIGVIVSSDRQDGGDKLELKDRQGNVFAVIYFNANNQCSIDVIFDSTVDIPERGDAIDVCGLVGVLVDDVKHKWEREKERMLTITGTRYPLVDLGGDEEG